MINVCGAGRSCAYCPNVSCARRSIVCGEISTVSGYNSDIEYGSADILCIDIGTTTLAFERAYSGGSEAFTSVNRQRCFGADVISRIDAANNGRLKLMQRSVLLQINDGITNLYRNGGEPERIVISANTAMVQFLLGRSCGQLGKYPFTAEVTDTFKTDWHNLFGAGAEIPVTVLPSLSGFIGGDIMSGLYMLDFDRSERVNLFIDLGTNGEMALGCRDGIIASSTAAGPAFEGGRIKCGTASVDGAICGVENGKITTINNKPPVGICGTGIVELTAQLLKDGIIDATGLLNSDYFESGYPLTDNIRFTQMDIREVQTAKAAVRTGAELLMKNYGCREADIDHVYIAGGFGYRLDMNKACAIGLISPDLAGKCVAVGNTSLGGAVKYAFDIDGEQRIEKVRSLCRELALAMDNEFNEKYIEYMNFGR